MLNGWKAVVEAGGTFIVNPDGNLALSEDFSLSGTLDMRGMKKNRGKGEGEGREARRCNGQENVVHFFNFVLIRW